MWRLKSNTFKKNAEEINLNNAIAFKILNYFYNFKIFTFLFIVINGVEFFS
jgi:hypothetical protein